MPSWNDSFDLVREHQIMARILAALVVLYIIVYAVGFAGASDV